jgi:hypothetical protein
MPKIVALLVGAVVLASAGCSTRGVNDPDSFAIYFKNDLEQPVVVALCHSDHSAKCEHPYYRDRIAPGADVPENISPDVRTEWAIETLGGRPLRCVVLYWQYWPGHDENVRVSAAPPWDRPCSRTTPTTFH